MWLFIYTYGAEGNEQSSFNVVYVMDWGAFSDIQFSRLLCLDLRNVNVKNNFRKYCLHDVCLHAAYLLMLPAERVSLY